MIKRFFVFVFLGVFCLSASGCFMLLAGAAGGAGTATWLSGKLVQEVDASLSKSVEASEKALESLDFAVTKKTVKSDVAQVMGEYTTGETI